MHYSVPIAAIFTALGLYAMGLGAFGLTSPEKARESGADLQSAVEWVAVICLGTCGFVAGALAVMLHFAEPYVHYAVATAVVGLVGVALWKVTSFTPAPLMAFLVNTRIFSVWRRQTRRRRGLYRMAREFFAESSLSRRRGEAKATVRARAAGGGVTLGLAVGAVDMTLLVVILGEDGVSGGFVLLWVALLIVLVGVFVAAGINLADRAKLPDEAPS